MSSGDALLAAALPAPVAHLTQTDVYRALRAEVAKLDSSSADVNWAQVESLARQVLTELGQDLLAAVYWVHARQVLQGAAVLPAGLELVSDLLQGCWEQLSPPVARIKARAGAMQWLLQRTEIALAANSEAPAPELAAAVQRLQDITQQRLPGQAPSFAGLRRSLAPRHAPPQQAPAPAPTLAPAPARSAPAAAQSPAAAAPGLDLLAIGRQLCSIAGERRAADNANPEAYRLLRVGLWLHVHTAPPQSEGRTRIAALPEASRTLLAHLLQQQLWLQLLEQVERLALDHRLCLDLQRLASAALQHLGPAYEPCWQAVRQEVRTFVGRVPEAARLLAADGTPLADAATQQWLLGLSHGAPASGSPVAPLPQLAAHTNDGQTGGRALFVQRLLQAESILQGGHVAVALALFTALHAKMRQRQLQGWEPSISIRVLRGYLACLRSTANCHSAAEKVFQQLARLDPEMAIGLQQ